MFVKFSFSLFIQTENIIRPKIYKTLQQFKNYKNDLKIRFFYYSKILCEKYSQWYYSEVVLPWRGFFNFGLRAKGGWELRRLFWGKKSLYAIQQPILFIRKLFVSLNRFFLKNKSKIILFFWLTVDTKMDSQLLIQLV